MKLEKDTTISHYKILSEIGKGGMGEVYLAQDTKLNRKVAIKFLSDEFSQDSDKLNRFIQEAQTASALNHPNIITIHEIGETDGAQYIALEYIEGETLTERLKKKLKFNSALDIATQIASALDAAHSAGIVHRDVKPDNVMIREDGLVKILDFGIAKLTEQKKPEIESEDKTAVQVNTSPGMIIGTANYMSPEQAKGKEVDKRTDIFSFGVVLYEMIAGHLPFAGESPLEIIGSILNKEPKPLNDMEVPADLRKIIGKTLRKDRDERYQTIKGLLADLKELKQELEIQDRLDKTIQPEDKDRQETQILKATTAQERKQTTNVTEAGKKSRWVFGIGAIGLAALAIFAGWYFLAGGLFSKTQAFTRIKTEKLTTAVSIDEPIISPDNKLIAYVRNGDLIVRQIGSGAENVLYEANSVDLDPFTFSPDGEYIYFGVEQFGETTDLFRISTFGGTPKKILENVVQSLFISTDGKKMAYKSRSKQDELPTSVYIANIDGSAPGKVYDAEDLNATDTELGGWSPDGTKILIALRKKSESGTSGPEGVQISVGTLDLTNNERPAKERFEEIHKAVWRRFRNPFWLPSGDGIIVTGATPGTIRDQLWHISYPEGELRRITDDNNDYRDVTVSPDGKTIAARTQLELVSLWSIDPADQKVRQVKAEQPGIALLSLSAMPDGRLIFLKESVSGTTVFSMNEDGTDEKEIFSVKEDILRLKASPDGKYFVASVRNTETRGFNLYRFNADGSERKQLTNFDRGAVMGIQVIPEDWVLFHRYTGTARTWGDPSEIMKVPLKGGKVEKLSGLEPSERDMHPRLSPDGKYLAYRSTLKDETDGKFKEYIRVTEFSDGKAGKKILERQVDVPRIRWLPDSSAIIYEEEGSDLANLFKLDLKTRTETQISDFNSKANTGDFVWNQTGKNIMALRESQIENLVLIRDMSDVEGQ
jgi:serine/threonine protein kinase